MANLRARVRPFITMRRMAEISLAVQVNRFFTSHSSALRDAFMLNGEQGVSAEIGKQEADLMEVFRKFNERNIGNLALAQYKNVIRKQGKKELAQDAIDKSRFVALSQEFIDEEGLRQSILISETSKKNVAKVISRGIEEGVGEAIIAREIGKTYTGTLARFRASAIARTETGTSSSYAQDLGARDTGLELMKQWVSVSDDATREDHLEVDGITIGVDDFFSVGSDSMIYPNDPSASAENVINCRCVVNYLPI